jgi:O-antigen/teichoic acid export membrane protein
VEEGVDSEVMIKTSDRNSLIAKNTIFLYLRMLLILLFSLYTSRVVLDYLGVEDYGIYTLVAGFVSMFSFLNASLTSSIQRFYNYEGGLSGDTAIIRVFNMSIYIEIIFSLVILVLLESFGLWYIDNKLVVPPERLNAARYIFHLSVVQLILIMLQAPFMALTLAKEKMNFFAIAGILEAALKLMIVLMLPLIAADKLIIYGLMSTGVTLAILLLYIIYVKHFFPYIRISFQWDKLLFKSMISFSGWSVFGSVAMVARNQGINVLLNLFFGTVVNAARGIAYQIQGAIMGFIQNITIATRPQLTEAYALGNFQRSEKLMCTISKVSFILLYILALPIIYKIDYILELWLGGNVPEYTAGFTKLILFSTLVDVLNTPVTMMIMATGDIKKYSYITSLIGLMILPCSYVLLNCGMSPNVVFVAGVFVSVLVQCASVFILRAKTGISLMSYFIKILSPLFLMVMLTWWIPFIINFIKCEPILSLFMTLIITIPSICIASYFICLDKGEKVYIHKLIRR